MPSPEPSSPTAGATSPGGPSRNREWLLQLVREQPALVLTGGYLALTALGLAYQFAFLLHFRVNVLDYAEVSDFLLAAIREPLVLVLALITLPLLWLLGVFREWLRKHSPRYDALARKTDTAASRRFTYPLFVATYYFLFALLYAERNAEQVKLGKGTRVHVTLQTASDRAGPPAEPTLLLGKTNAFIFLYHPAERRTHVVPIENLAHITVERLVRPPRRDR